jgi:hypothetical protein
MTHLISKHAVDRVPSTYAPVIRVNIILIGYFSLKNSLRELLFENPSLCSIFYKNYFCYKTLTKHNEQNFDMHEIKNERKCNIGTFFVIIQFKA